MRIALGGSVANTGRSSLDDPVPALRASRLARSKHPLDAEAHERHRALHGGGDRLRAVALDQLGRVRALGQLDHAQLELPLRRERRCPQHRLLPGAVGVEGQQHRLRHPRELADLLGVSGPCPSAPPRCASPPGAARSHRCTPRTGSPAPPAPHARAPGPPRRGAGPCGRRRCRTCSGTSAGARRPLAAARAPLVLARSIARAPKPSTRPRMSASGNMIRERNRS